MTFGDLPVYSSGAGPHAAVPFGILSRYIPGNDDDMAVESSCARSATDKITCRVGAWNGGNHGRVDFYLVEF